MSELITPPEPPTFNVKPKMHKPQINVKTNLPYRTVIFSALQKLMNIVQKSKAKAEPPEGNMNHGSSKYRSFHDHTWSFFSSDTSAPGYGLFRSRQCPEVIRSFRIKSEGMSQAACEHFGLEVS